MVRQTEKQVVEFDQSHFNVQLLPFFDESVFQRFVIRVKPPKESDEVQRIRCRKCPVLEFEKRSQVLGSVMDYEVIRIVVHHRKQLPAFADDGHTLTPRECRGK
jgi:hypothetical protein